ncbi:MAG: hypothetical protein M3N21_01615 [Actinomycetota bacterium]|nr:hypothetical protein [Actinomycetota bacterium]
MTAYASHLRVYEPLAAFDGAERRFWEAYTQAGEHPGRAQGPAIEREASLRAMAARVPTSLPVLPEQAFVADVDGVTLVCPWRSALRCAEALADFRDGLPDEVADAFIPRTLADEAESLVETWRVDHPALRTHILTSCWQVPLRWFVLVDADEREVRLGATGPGVAPARTGRELVYRTAMSRARRRTARALAVLRRTVDDGAVTAGVEDLGRWLEEFHPRSLVELDYGGLVHLLDDAELRQDESARDVALALTALADGAPARAAAAYSRVTARMKALQGIEAAN